MCYLTSYYQQANCQAESSNKLVLNFLKKRLKTTKERWLEKLPSALWAIKTSPRGSTKKTPFSLVYGTKVVILIEIKVSIVIFVQTKDQKMSNKAIDLVSSTSRGKKE